MFAAREAYDSFAWWLKHIWERCMLRFGSKSYKRYVMDTWMYKRCDTWLPLTLPTPHAICDTTPWKSMLNMWYLATILPLKRHGRFALIRIILGNRSDTWIGHKRAPLKMPMSMRRAAFLGVNVGAGIMITAGSVFRYRNTSKLVPEDYSHIKGLFCMLLDLLGFAQPDYVKIVR